ncbi:MAG: KH domain-containing protein [Clostridiales bacterium]|nr:KH domain-containing protein [Clostridiales bacterium]
MKDLLISILKGLVDNPDEVSVEVVDAENGVTEYRVHVAQEDMGRVIGKQGRIAKAIRVVMRAAATRNDQRVSVEIE